MLLTSIKRMSCGMAVSAPCSWMNLLRPPLVGMALLRGWEYKMQVRARGKVTIKRLPRR